MKENVSLYLNIPQNYTYNLTPVYKLAANGGQLSLDLTALSSILEGSVTTRCKLAVVCKGAAFALVSAHLYSKDSNNVESLLDLEFSSGMFTNYTLYFDITNFVHKRLYSSHQLIIKNTGINDIYIVSGNASSCYIVTHHPYETISTSKNGNTVSLDDDTAFTYDHLTHRQLLKINYLNGVFPSDFSFVYSNYSRNDTYSSFPKGWKLSLLDYIVVDSTNNIVKYFDKNNILHTFKPITNLTDNYYSIDGSGLLLKKENNKYILFNEINNARKEFDLNGNPKDYYGINGEHTSFTYSNSVLSLITDQNGNTFGFTFSSNSIVILINNSKTITLNKSNSELSTIVYSDTNSTFSYTNSFTFSSGKLTNINLFNNNKLSLSYDGSKVSSIIQKYNNNVIEQCDYQYEFLKIYITNRHQVKIFYRYDDELNLISSGEDKNEGDMIFVGSCYDGYAEKISYSLDYPVGREYGDVAVYEYDDNEHSYDPAIITPSFSTEADKEYMVLVTLEKANQFSFNSNRYVKLDIISQVTTVIGTFEFDPGLKKQTIAIPFKAISQSCDIRFKSKGITGDVGPVYLTNIFMVELNGSQTEYFYAQHASGSGEYENVYNWQKISDDNSYSYKDLIRNYLSNINNSHFYWSENLGAVTYNPNDSNSLLSSNGGYIFNGNRIRVINNLIFGKKTTYKRFDVDNELVTLYDFEFFIKKNSRYEKHVYKHRQNNVYHETSVYNLSFYLIKEIDNDGNYTEYVRDSNNNVVTIKKGDANSNEYIVSESTYDLKNRLSSSSSLMSNSLGSESFNYLGNTELLSSFVDMNNVSQSNTYDSALKRLITVSKSSSSIDTDVNSTETSVIYSNDSELKLTKGNLGHVNVFSIKNTSNSFANVEQYELTLSSSEDIYSKSYLSTYNYLKYCYNKYGNLAHIIQYFNTPGIGYSQMAKFLYYDDDKVPSDLTNVTTQDYSLCSQKSRLYKTIDDYSNETTYYNYSSDGVISIDVQGYYSYSINYTYSNDGRINSVSYSESQFPTHSYEITYFDECSNDVKKYTYFVALFVTSELKKDSFSRPAEIESGILLGLTPNKDKKVFTYYSKTINGSNYISQLVKQIDYYKGQGFFNNYSLDYSHFIEYQNNGFISSIKKGTSTPSSTLVSYTYDSNGRLLTENNIEYGYSFSYSYDNNGNITSVSKTNLSNNQVTTESYSYDSYFKDKLVSFNSQTISYNSRYQITSIGNNISFSWDSLRLTSVERNNNTTSFLYNYKGVRTAKTCPNGDMHDYLLEGNKIVAERITNSNNEVSNIKYFYGHDGVFGFNKDGNNYFFRKNILGDVIEIRMSGNLVAKYVYDAWGNHKVLDSSGVEITSPTHIANINPFRYRSYYYDRETNLYYCLSRYYSPELRRWISLDDPSYIDNENIDGINLFAYCKNNPVMYADPDGNSISALLIAALIGAFAGAIIGGAAGGIAAASTGKDVWTGVWTGAVGGAIVGAGAAIGSVFVAPVVLAIGGNSLSAGASLVIGFSIGFGSGAIGGATQNALFQLVNNKWDWHSIDGNQIWKSAIKNGIFNILSTFLGGLVGITELSRFVSFLLSLQLNVIPSGYTLISDIIEYFVQEKKRI